MKLIGQAVLVLGIVVLVAGLVLRQMNILPFITMWRFAIAILLTSVAIGVNK